MMSTCLESNAVQGYVILFKWIRVLSKNARHTIHHFLINARQVKQEKSSEAAEVLVFSSVTMVVTVTVCFKMG